MIQQDFAKYLEYLSNRDCGASARAIIYRMTNVNKIYQSHPHDPDDFSRCIKLLNVFPEFRDNLQDMQDVSIEWKLLIDNWDELEALFHAEEYESLYTHMKKLFHNIPCVSCGKPLNGSYKGNVNGQRFHFRCFPE